MLSTHPQQFSGKISVLIAFLFSLLIAAFTPVLAHGEGRAKNSNRSDIDLSTPKLKGKYAKIGRYSGPVDGARNIHRSPGSTENYYTDSEPSGQGEAMLLTNQLTRPKFLEKDRPSRKTHGASLQVQGICTDRYGLAHTTLGSNISDGSNLEYENCLDERNRSSGNSVHDYFGRAQNQAGSTLLLVH